MELKEDFKSMELKGDFKSRDKLQALFWLDVINDFLTELGCKELIPDDIGDFNITFEYKKNKRPLVKIKVTYDYGAGVHFLKFIYEKGILKLDKDSFYFEK